jgi:oxygen-independent coproporphyrinogen-3 oxidase
VHAYIHVPFCGRRCSYCDFAIAVRSRTPDADFVEAIRREWTTRREHPALGAPFDTIYFGGGTPSRLEPASLATLIDLLAGDHGLAPDAEVTLEANPDDVNPDLAAAWRAAGINRVSLGVQSHEPAVLAWMHRTHRAEQVEPAIAALREAGLDNFSVDLIFALPPEVPRDWARDLERTLALDPAHVSLYGLTVEPHTPLSRWTARGTAHEAPEERYAEEYLAAHRALVGSGYVHYEVSNAARPGHRSRHNSAYWGHADYIGLGPSAHSLLDGVRSWNEREWEAYRRRAVATGVVEAGHERLDAEQQRLEGWYLGLRTDAGIEAQSLAPTVREAWSRAGWAVEDGDRLRLTAEGWLRLDALVTAAGGS